jgi:hypothetical protein
MRYGFGKIDPWWNDEYKNFEYTYLPHKDQAMVDQWKYSYTNVNLNGAIHELRDNEYALKFLQIFDWKNSGAALYKMNTGDVLPIHKDHYIAYRNKFKINDSYTIWRAIVFMEDWKSGHYFEIDGNSFLNWKKGDYVFWNYDVLHMAANIGVDPRYTLQITGHQ